MKNITKKCKERHDDMKSFIANSDEKLVDSKIFHCGPEKMRLMGKRIRGCYDPGVYHNFNHFAIEDNSFSMKIISNLLQETRLKLMMCFKFYMDFHFLIQ